MVPADSDKISRVSPYSGYFTESTEFRLQDYHLLRFGFPTNSTILWICNSYVRSPTTPILRLVWALTVSLATTKVIDFSFFSSCYLDVSVHRVVLYITMCSLCDTNVLLLVSSLIRISPDQSLLTAPRSIS